MSGIAIDNAPFTSTLVDVAIRKPQNFKPEEGRKAAWRLKHIPTGNTLQSGIVTTGTDGLVSIPGLKIFRDPDRCRLELQKLPKLSGILGLEDCADPAQPITFEFRPAAGGPSATRTLTLTPDGHAFTPAKNVTISTSAGDVTGVNAALRGGDANNDNSVDFLDLDALIQAFNAMPADANWNEGADLNCDDSVDFLDLDLLIRNFNKTGDA
jgi:hypothetical protein